jgi:hypothetical protein
VRGLSAVGGRSKLQGTGSSPSGGAMAGVGPLQRQSLCSTDSYPTVLC